MKNAVRQDAVDAGSKQYWSDIPCSHGHIGFRQTSNASCIVCRQKWAAENVEKMRTSRKKWRTENPEVSAACTRSWADRNPEKVKEKRRRLHEINRDSYNTRSRLWNKENFERASARGRAWKIANRENVCAHSSKRRALKIMSTGEYTGEDVREIRRLQKNKCAYCRVCLRNGKTHIDHIMPLALGGSNGRENIQILCSGCNLSKGARHPVEFAQRIGRLL